MDTLTLILDYAIVPLFALNIWLVMQNFELKRQVGLLEQSHKNHETENKDLWDEFKELESDIKSELKEINTRINELPAKIVELIRGK